MTSPPVQRALISVSDKTGLAEFARGLVASGVELFSTGGTRQHLLDQELPVRDVADYTGFPEMLDGRLKTLHPKIHGGILCRRDRADDMAALAAHGIATFEIVVVNLYPFQQTVARPGVTLEHAVENIDIGGPSMVRAAAKNHPFVAVVTSPDQYADVLAQVQATKTTTLELRRRLALAAYTHTAAYDRAIAAYLSKVGFGGSAQMAETTDAAFERDFPGAINVSLTRRAELRYGENPHQRAAVYAVSDAPADALVDARQINGKELSYNNLLDLDSALAIVRPLSLPAMSVIKHNNPCGAAQAKTLAQAAKAALEADPLSAFGSVLAVNRPVDAATAEVLAAPGTFIEAVAAPSFEPEALAILTTKPKWKQNVRLLELGEVAPSQPARELRRIEGGFLCQDADVRADDEAQWKVATKTTPTDAQLEELRFAWALVRHVKSNAIVVTRDGAVCGVGAGQMSRVDSTEIALRKSGAKAAGAVLASDAFFPFPDSIELAAKAGIKAVIQPGGSKNDDESIAACDKHGIAMVLTGCRHFRH